MVQSPSIPPHQCSGAPGIIAISPMVSPVTGNQQVSPSNFPEKHPTSRCTQENYIRGGKNSFGRFPRLFHPYPFPEKSQMISSECECRQQATLRKHEGSGHGLSRSNRFFLEESRDESTLSAPSPKLHHSSPPPSSLQLQGHSLHSFMLLLSQSKSSGVWPPLPSLSPQVRPSKETILCWFELMEQMKSERLNKTVCMNDEGKAEDMVHQE